MNGLATRVVVIGGAFLASVASAPAESPIPDDYPQVEGGLGAAVTLKVDDEEFAISARRAMESNSDKTVYEAHYFAESGENFGLQLPSVEPGTYSQADFDDGVSQLLSWSLDPENEVTYFSDGEGTAGTATVKELVEDSNTLWGDFEGTVCRIADDLTTECVVITDGKFSTTGGEL